MPSSRFSWTATLLNWPWLVTSFWPSWIRSLLFSFQKRNAFAVCASLQFWRFLMLFNWLCSATQECTWWNQIRLNHHRAGLSILLWLKRWENIVDLEFSLGFLFWVSNMLKYATFCLFRHGHLLILHQVESELLRICAVCLILWLVKFFMCKYLFECCMPPCVVMDSYCVIERWRLVLVEIGKREY